jgi:hypothetical protein
MAAHSSHSLQKQINELRDIARGTGVPGLHEMPQVHQINATPTTTTTTTTTTGNPARPQTTDSNSSNNVLDYNEWDAYSTMTNFTQSIFDAETDTSEDDDSSPEATRGFRDRDSPGYQSLNILHALFNAATRETGTSTIRSEGDTLQRARSRARRPAYQVPRDVSPETREFYRSIGLTCGEKDVGQNGYSDFIAMPKPRGYTCGTRPQPYHGNEI